MTSPIEELDRAAKAPWDAIVVGAGPAGSLAAREIAKNGRKVLLVERRTFPRWKVCGACLNGRGLAVLDAVGLVDFASRLHAIPLKTFDLRHRGRSALLPLPTGVALSRACMDAALTEEARFAGADVLMETHAAVLSAGPEFREVTLTRDRHTIKVSARIVVVAAGLGQHCVADEPDLHAQAIEGSRMGAGCEVEDFDGELEPGTLGMAVGHHGYVGLVRVETGRLNIAAAFERDWLRTLGTPGLATAAVLVEAGFPAVAGLDDATWQGTVGLTRRVRIAGANRLLLVGDAVGYVEPFTGEGMAWALASGQAVVPFVVKGINHWDPTTPGEWTRLHRRLIGNRQRICRVLAGVLRRPMLTGLAIEALARRPGIARPFLNHMNATHGLMDHHA